MKLIKKNIPICIISGNFSESFIKEECINRKINLAGYHGGFFSEEETSDIISIINRFNSKVYLIGMGIPKQEYFAYELNKTQGNKIIICVGNLVEFYFGTIKRAPLFFQKLGIEWVFRLITEPKRLLKRYLIGIPYFIYLGLKIKLKNKRSELY